LNLAAVEWGIHEGLHQMTLWVLSRSRPLFRKTSEQLEQMADRNGQSAAELRLLLSELGHRKTSSAKRLIERIVTCLAMLENVPDISPSTDRIAHPLTARTKDVTALSIRMTASVAGKVGFASHQNAVPILRELEVHNVGPHKEGTAVAELEVRHLASLVRTPSMIAQSSLQSNWNASPGAKDSGTKVPLPLICC
jgi:hypothetical protein